MHLDTATVGPPSRPAGVAVREDEKTIVKQGSRPNVGF
jgi:hypothetical protein